MASDKDIRKMYDKHFKPFFDEVLPKIIRKLNAIAGKLGIVDTAEAPKEKSSAPNEE